MAIFLSTQAKKRDRWMDLQKLQNIDGVEFDEQSKGFIWLFQLLDEGKKSEAKLKLANDLWQWCGRSIRGLSACSLESLLGFPGIQLRDVELICLSMSLARLRLEEEATVEGIRNSSSAMKMIQSKFFGAQCEKFYCIYLNRANRVLRIELLSLGGISSTVVDIRLLMKRALDLYASAILVAHNHPSGNLVPSDEDIELTNKIKRAGELLDIRLIDHLIVFENQYFSMADEGKI